MQLLSDESVLTECQVNKTQVVYLTNFRVILASLNGEESFLLKGVIGAGVHEDVPKGLMNIQKENASKRGRTTTVTFFIGLVLFLYFLFATPPQYYIAAGLLVASVLIGQVIPISSGTSKKFFVLAIYYQGGKRTIEIEKESDYDEVFSFSNNLIKEIA